MPNFIDYLNKALTELRNAQMLIESPDDRRYFDIEKAMQEVEQVIEDTKGEIA